MSQPELTTISRRRVIGFAILALAGMIAVVAFGTLMNGCGSRPDPSPEPSASGLPSQDSSPAQSVDAATPAPSQSGGPASSATPETSVPPTPSPTSEPVATAPPATPPASGLPAPSIQVPPPIP